MKWLKWGGGILLTLIVSIAVLVFGAKLVLTDAMEDSLPKLDGEVKGIGLESKASLSRDALGLAVISAKHRRDAMYALGFAHGQDRFFQMDLLRRKSAGSLAELLGESALEQDITARFHQFYKRSRDVYTRLPDEQRAVYIAYAKGVNEALANQNASFEYTALRAEPQLWQPEDSLLVVYSMYMDLQKANIERDESLIVIEQTFGKEMVEFITQPSEYQAAIDGSRLELASMAIPKLDLDQIAHVHDIGESDVTGSNNWAVSGQLTPSNKAMVSDDMHLGLSVPTLWYRAQLNYEHQDEKVQVTGVTLPGVPGVVVGSNGHIAWGYTNSFVDNADWFALSENDNTYEVEEQIPLGDGEFHTLTLTMSDFGPVKIIDGKPYALSWTAHKTYAVNAKLAELSEIHTVHKALSSIANIGIPAQNFVVVDTEGNIGWGLIGAITARKTPVNGSLSSKEYSSLWDQNLTSRPQVINPEHGRLWSANARTVSVDEHQSMGDGGYVLGARAKQIRDRLFEKSSFVEQDFYDIQLDNEARFLTPWQALLLSLLERNNQSGEYSADIQYLKSWQGCACPDSVGYTLVHEFYNFAVNEIWAHVESELVEQGASLNVLKRNLEPALWQLLTKQPESWLNGHKSWDSLLLNAYKTMTDDLAWFFGDDISQWKWGDVNSSQIEHPFSLIAPMFADLLDMPSYQGHGGKNTPAVQSPRFGASQRFIARPGALNDAIMTLPGGQSGNPLSPFYRAGYEAFVNNESTPLLPGEIIHTLTLNSK